MNTFFFENYEIFFARLNRQEEAILTVDLNQMITQNHDSQKIDSLPSFSEAILIIDSHKNFPELHIKSDHITFVLQSFPVDLLDSFDLIQHIWVAVFTNNQISHEYYLPFTLMDDRFS